VVFSLLLMLFILPYAFSVPGYVPDSDSKPFAESHFAKVDGVLIHFREWKPAKENGKGSILLVNGFAGSTFSWRRNIDTLVSSGYHVVAVDVPPFGYSSKQKNVNHSTTSNAQMIWKLADSLSSDSWILAGHSMGASIVGAMAAMNPERTAKVVFVDGLFSNTEQSTGPSIGGWAMASGPVKQLAEVVAGNYYYNYPRFKKLLASAYSQEPDSAAVMGYLEPFKIKRTTSAILELSRAWEIKTLSFSAIKAPVLIIWGSKDTWIPIENAHRFIEKYPSVQLKIIDGAGHCSMETHPAIFNGLLLDFLNK
ncbi:MAG: alpha/beta hydrolase, partial [Bacteroidota bacterium]